MCQVRTLPASRHSAVCCAVALVLSWQPAAAGPHDADFRVATESARETARSTVERLALPGLAAAVAVDGKLVWAEGFGYADVAARTPVTVDTQFRIGSLSKLITAAVAARLAESGRLDLDAPVQKYVHWFPPKAHTITPRQLLGHTSGIRHYAPKDFVTGFAAGAGRPLGYETFKDDPLLFEPGTRYAYSSYGYFLLGAVIESASGRSFEQYATTAVLEPLGMRRTTAERRGAPANRRAVFYARGADGSLTPLTPSDAGARLPAGGFLSTAGDLVRFGVAHTRPGFYSQQALTALLTPQTLCSGESTGVGLAWRVGVSPQGHRVYHHGGAMDGCRVFLLVDADAHIVVALLSNVQADFGEPEARAIASAFAASAGPPR